MPSFSRNHLSLITTGQPYDAAPEGAWTYAPAYDEYATEAYTPLDAEEMPASTWVDSDAGEEPWRLDALCAETDPEAFFPEKGGSTREAKRVCNGCTVRAECLEFALTNDERFGIWGGLSERERRRLRLQRRELTA